MNFRGFSTAVRDFAAFAAALRKSGESWIGVFGEVEELSVRITEMTKM